LDDANARFISPSTYDVSNWNDLAAANGVLIEFFLV
jgi:hypothetical protein